MATYRYLVLGTTRALRPDGCDAPVSGARLRALLAALAAGAGQPVPAREPTAQSWGGEDGPADAVPAMFTGAVAGLDCRLDCIDGEHGSARARARHRRCGGWSRSSTGWLLI
ncbi:hypothetical protein ACIQ7Q_10530 [Streptomyces sp. NPDC096176]|uniref:hypothetical protein n=1 Tax=Streptomyces sp. NPDC096176 TaxID=3366079 RepID=UPI00381EA7B0